MWKEIREKYRDDVIIPIWLYADEYEVNDSQSSHNTRHSVCGVYYSFSTIPDEFRSKLHNIFVAAMLKKVDIKQVGMNKLMQALIVEFRNIEENGLMLMLNGTPLLVRFVLCLVQGDNLGVQSMLSFSGGFNATYYCRFCRRPKELLIHDTKEHADCLRRKADYEEDVGLARQSDTGISDFTVFNDLPSFHAVENKSVDAMHDLYSKGICEYGLSEVLNYCIYKKKFLHLERT